MQLLRAVVDAVLAHGQFEDLDAILLPASFLRLSQPIGRMTHDERFAALTREQVHRPLMKLAKRLQRRSPGIHIISGIDSAAVSHNERGDQFCCAWDARGITGIARKIFPSNGDSNGDGFWPITCHEIDYCSSFRFIDLPSGHRAALATCYDIFGFAEKVPHRSPRTKYMRYLVDTHGVERYLNDRGFDDLRRRCITQFARLVDEVRPTVALAAIHGFERPGRDLFFQRHGLAGASAALRGALSVGAAHFYEKLDLWGAPLASAGIRAGHLKLGLNRQAHALHPSVAISVTCDAGTAAVRLFEISERTESAEP